MLRACVTATNPSRSVEAIATTHEKLTTQTPSISSMCRTSGGWTGRGAAAAGMAVCLFELVGYYATAQARGYSTSESILVFWTACALVGGPIFGLSGSSLAHRPVHRLGHVASPPFTTTSSLDGWLHSNGHQQQPLPRNLARTRVWRALTAESFPEQARGSDLGSTVRHLKPRSAPGRTRAHGERVSKHRRRLGAPERQRRRSTAFDHRPDEKLSSRAMLPRKQLVVTFDNRWE